MDKKCSDKSEEEFVLLRENKGKTNFDKTEFELFLEMEHILQG